MTLLQGLAILLLCQSVGEAAARLLRIGRSMVRGFALGTASHGIGAARALQVHPDASAYAGLTLGLQAVLAALLMPLLARWLP